MTNRREQSHFSFFTSAWPVLLWLPCSAVSVTLSFLNNGFQAGYTALMCICKTYSKAHSQSVPGPQPPGKEHIPAGLLTGLPTPAWKRKNKRNESSKSPATLVWFPVLISTFLYQKCSGLNTAKERKGNWLPFKTNASRFIPLLQEHGELLVHLLWKAPLLPAGWNLDFTVHLQNIL